MSSAFSRDDDDSAQIAEPTAEASLVPCQWFAACNNPATTFRTHPYLGDVPICAQCDQLVESLI
jgi:hypothetical protein